MDTIAGTEREGERGSAKREPCWRKDAIEERSVRAGWLAGVWDWEGVGVRMGKVCVGVGVRVGVREGVIIGFRGVGAIGVEVRSKGEGTEVSGVGIIGERAVVGVG